MAKDWETGPVRPAPAAEGLAADARGEQALGTVAPRRDVGAADDEMPEDGLGVPSPGEVTGREAATTEGRGADAWPAPPGQESTALRVPLLPHGEREQWETRLLQTVAGFVDAPRAAVEEADRELEEIAARFGEAVTRRRRTLRMSWQEGVESDTEQLRLALRDYEELAGRLLHF
ncbi:hypothetical protein ABZ471_08215 [Streptomyces sp. NPDC005728]|uniref:hypothetical protein n=1 Tax=Streptomyces sp. NPDC005728 TaxID=3157054 RepID=UPI0033CE73E4